MRKKYKFLGHNYYVMDLPDIDISIMSAGCSKCEMPRNEKGSCPGAPSHKDYPEFNKVFKDLSRDVCGNKKYFKFELIMGNKRKLNIC